MATNPQLPLPLVIGHYSFSSFCTAINEHNPQLSLPLPSDAALWRLQLQVVRGEDVDLSDALPEMIRTRRRRVMRPYVQVKVGRAVVLCFEWEHFCRCHLAYLPSLVISVAWECPCRDRVSEAHTNGFAADSGNGF